MTSARPARPPLVSRRAAFWAVGTVFFLFVFANGAPTPLYGIYQARWHFSATTLTALFAVYALALLAALRDTALAYNAVIAALVAAAAAMTGLRHHPDPAKPPASPRGPYHHEQARHRS